MDAVVQIEDQADTRRLCALSELTSKRAYQPQIRLIGAEE